VPGDGEHSLAGIAIFQGLDDAELGRLEARCRWQSVESRERILEYGSASREVFFIVRGGANVLNTGPTGRGVAFATLRAGDCFGELAAIDGNLRSASVVASEDTLLAVLPSEVFIELLQRRAEVTFRLLQQLTRMVRRGDVRIMELSTLAASHRVFAELLRMAKPDAAVAGRWLIYPVPPLREVAAHVSTTRETVARVVGQLYRSGLLRRRGRTLYLLDRARLEEIVRSLQHEGS
jgi:CRP-like cAMP-binding protein